MPWYFPGGPVAKTVLPLKGAQVRSLVKELRSLVEEYASWCGKKKCLAGHPGLTQSGSTF